MKKFGKGFPSKQVINGSFSKKRGKVGKNMDVRVKQNWVRETLEKVLNISEPQLPHFEMEMKV